MQILEHGQEQEQTLLFFPCTAEPVWAFPPERFTLRGHDPVKEYDTMEVCLKTLLRPDGPQCVLVGQQSRPAAAASYCG